MHIPLTNLTRQYKQLHKSINDAVLKAFARGDYILGKDVDRFEEEYAKYIGTKFCIGVGNGTDALRLMLKAIDIGPGDEVITQANTFIATVLPVIELGAKVILVDVDEETGAIQPDLVKKAITSKTKLILPVHLFGYPAPMDELKRLTKESRILIAEDAAQAQGSVYKGKHLGSFGVASAFSFYPGKNLGAYGDGGAIVTNNKEIAEKIRVIRNIGMTKKYHHTMLGTNSRLDTVQAAILSVKLKHLDTWNRKRNAIAKVYQKQLAGVGDIMLPPAPPKDILTNYHQFVITTKKRDALGAYLDKNGVATVIHYPFPLHLTPALKDLGYKKGDFPVSEKRADRMLSIPMFPEMSETEQKYVITKIRAFFRQ